MTYILFAEDDAASQQLIQDTLEAQGYRVRSVSNGIDALTMALADKPGLVLLDVMMPGKNGLEVTRAIKEHYGEDAPPVILITALGSLDNIEQGRLAGADDYITKPFSPEVLSKKVVAALGEA